MAKTYTNRQLRSGIIYEATVAMEFAFTIAEGMHQATLAAFVNRYGTKPLLYFYFSGYSLEQAINTITANVTPSDQSGGGE